MVKLVNHLLVGVANTTEKNIYYHIIFHTTFQSSTVVDIHLIYMHMTLAHASESLAKR